MGSSQIIFSSTKTRWVQHLKVRLHRHEKVDIYMSNRAYDKGLKTMTYILKTYDIHFKKPKNYVICLFSIYMLTFSCLCRRTLTRKKFSPWIPHDFWEMPFNMGKNEVFSSFEPVNSLGMAQFFYSKCIYHPFN